MSGTIVAGVMGWPISHSRSPLLHGTWLKRYGINGTYVPFAVEPDRLEQALRALPALGIVGVNLTVSLKERAAAIVDHLDEAAAATRSVNMVTVLSDGSLAGGSTDGYGFMAHLKASAPDWQPGSGAVLVVGAGGAARAIVSAMSLAGATNIRVANRTDGRATVLAADLGAGISAWPWSNRRAALRGCGLVINTTTQGMDGQPPLDLDLDALDPAAFVADIVYTPLETPLLAAARNNGNRVIDGLGMLLHQARPAFARWFGRDPEVDQDLRDTVLASLK